MASNIQAREPAGFQHFHVEPNPRVTIHHSVDESIVGNGVTCNMEWRNHPIYTPIEDSTQKLIICTLCHLRWSAIEVGRAVNVLTGGQRPFAGTDIKRISNHIHISRRDSHLAGDRLESIYWDAITRDDQEWRVYAETKLESTEMAQSNLPILEKKVDDRFISGLPGPSTFSKQEASDALRHRDREGLRSVQDLEQKFWISSVKTDSSGYILCEIQFLVGGKKGPRIGPQLQKFIICTIYYNHLTWSEKDALDPARSFLKAHQMLLRVPSLCEVVRYIEIQVQKQANPANRTKTWEYWSHILDYDHRWLEYAESWHGGKFTGRKPPVIDPPPDQPWPRHFRDGRPVLRNHSGQITFPRPSGERITKDYHTIYLSQEGAMEWRTVFRLRHPNQVNPLTNIPFHAVESGLPRSLTGGQDGWKIPQEDYGKPFPVIAVDGFLIGDVAPNLPLPPAEAAESQKRARDSTTPRSTGSGDNGGPEQRGRQQGGQGGQSSRSSSKADPRSQSSSGRTMTKAEGKQRESQRGKHR